jgi:hypothetical protein
MDMADVCHGYRGVGACTPNAAQLPLLLYRPHPPAGGENQLGDNMRIFASAFYFRH